MTQGSLDALAANPNGLIIGEGLAKKFGVSMGGVINTVSPAGEPRALKVVGIFRTGNANYDETQTFALLKRVQGLLDRPDRVNRFILQFDDPHTTRGWCWPTNRPAIWTAAPPPTSGKSCTT